MSETILFRKGHSLTHMPRATWEAQLSHAPAHSEVRLRFMTPEHHRVRYFAVEELARRAEPLKPEDIATALDLPRARVWAILDDLERHLFFLVRDERGAVTWAYPVTVEPTPHSLFFSTGERLYAA